MERKGDHGLDSAEVHADTAVIVGDIRRIEFSVVLRSAVSREVILCILIGPPDRGQTGGLCRHDVDAVPIVRIHGSYAGADKFHDLILDITVLEDRADDGQCDILRTNTGSGLSLQINRDNAGISDIVGVTKELFAQLAAALADGHGAERSVAGMGIRAQDHFAAACHRFAHVLMNDRDVRGHIDAAVFLSGAKSEHVVILIDGAAHRAQGVVAVGQNIGKGEFLHSRSTGRLDDTDKGDIVGRHGIKADLQMIHVVCCIVGF